MHNTYLYTVLQKSIPPNLTLTVVDQLQYFSVQISDKCLKYCPSAARMHAVSHFLCSLMAVD